MNMWKSTNQKQTAAINLWSGIVIDTEAQRLHCQTTQCISAFVYGASQIDFSVLVVFTEGLRFKQAKSFKDLNLKSTMQSY